MGRLVGADPSELANAIGRYLMTPAPANAQIATGASEAAPKPTIATSDDTNSGLTPELRARLEQLVNQSPLMVFMKGSPDNVRCKFSRQMVELLNETKFVFRSSASGICSVHICVLRQKYSADFSSGCRLSYGHFDILSDESVRQGLKQLSNWPTYPQLYAGGRLVGGVDIVSQMRADGSLLPELRAAFESK